MRMFCLNIFRICKPFYLVDFSAVYLLTPRPTCLFRNGNNSREDEVCVCVFGCTRARECVRVGGKG